MKTVFVCSPLRGEYERNLSLARGLCRAASISEGVATFAPHLFYTQFLTDTVDSERHFGMLAGTVFLSKCDEVWVYDARGISEGMKKEIELAKSKNIPVVHMPDCWKWIAEQGW